MTRGEKASAAVCAAVLAVVSAAHLIAATHYVWQDSPSPASPYTDWFSAAHTIQDAVDAAVPGDTVLVTNGVYTDGGGFTPDLTFSNRVVITQPITVKSVNGPAGTVIVGAPDPSTGKHGFGATRGVFMTNGAMLAGFTVSNAHGAGWFWDVYGGGVHAVTESVVSNCIITECTALGSGGAFVGDRSLITCSLITQCTNDFELVVGLYYGSTMDNCIVAGNYAGGMGSVLSTVMNSMSVSNRGPGSALRSYNADTISNCFVAYNTCEGGSLVALNQGSVLLCTIVSNVADYDAGVHLSTDSLMNRCTVTHNDTRLGGGGGIDCDDGAAVYNTLIAFNHAGGSGGGVRCGTGATLNNCTVAENSAGVAYGGVYSADGVQVRNCIMYFNQAGQVTNSPDCGGPNTYISSCAPGLAGNGNTNADPRFVNYPNGDFHLAPLSPCINAGSNQYAYGQWDLDGNPRIRPSGGSVDMGAYEAVPEPLMLWSALALLFGMRRK